RAASPLSWAWCPQRAAPRSSFPTPRSSRAAVWAPSACACSSPPPDSLRHAEPERRALLGRVRTRLHPPLHGERSDHDHVRQIEALEREGKEEEEGAPRDEDRRGEGPAARGDAATEEEEDSGPYGDAEEDARGKPRAEEEDRGSDHLQVGADAGLLRPGMDRVLEEGVGEDRPPAVRVREVEQPHAHGREPQGDADGEK